MTTKERVIAAINATVWTAIKDYDGDDCIYSQKYRFSPVDIVYLLFRLERDFGFSLDEDFVDSLEMCTFSRLEKLLELRSKNNAQRELAR